MVLHYKCVCFSCECLIHDQETVPTFLCLPLSSLPSSPQGLVGVSPSPLNCSSADHTTNTCTVYASVNSSITLCADFTQTPNDASRYAELVTMLWEQVTNDGPTTIWRCQENQCSNDSPPVGYRYSENWGRCLHVDHVEANSVFRYKIFQLTPPKPYPAGFTGIVHREVSFSVQG